MSETYSLWPEIIARKKEEREKERVQLLAITIESLKSLAPQFALQTACITGSLVQAGRFHSHSDIDIAVTGLNDSNYFSFMAAMQHLLPRQVEVTELDKCRFADKIIETGLQVV